MRQRLYALRASRRGWGLGHFKIPISVGLFAASTSYCTGEMNIEVSIRYDSIPRGRNIIQVLLSNLINVIPTEDRASSNMSCRIGNDAMMPALVLRRVGQSDVATWINVHSDTSELRLTESEMSGHVTPCDFTSVRKHLGS